MIQVTHSLVPSNCTGKTRNSENGTSLKGNNVVCNFKILTINGYHIDKSSILNP